jgi:hypothetical protein
VSTGDGSVRGFGIGVDVDINDIMIIVGYAGVYNALEELQTVWSSVAVTGDVRAGSMP